MNRYDELCQRFRNRWGDRFDPSSLESAGNIRRAYITTNVRVKVEGPTGTRYGVISTTTGWRPSFLLVHRCTDLGSGDLLGPEDRVTAVQINGRYRPSSFC